MPEVKIVTAPVSGVADVKVAVGDSISEGGLLAIQSMVKVHAMIKWFTCTMTHLDGRPRRTFHPPLQDASRRSRSRERQLQREM